MTATAKLVRRTCHALLATAVVVAAPGVAGQEATPGQALEWIEELAQGHVDEGRFSGVVAVSLGGQAAYVKGFGRVGADDPGVPGAGSSLAIGSISKSFTAAVIVQLFAEGRLTPESSVRTVFPDFPEEFDRVRIRHLLDHTSSIEELVGPNVEGGMDPADLLTPDAVRLTGTPGRDFRYSNTGYLLLGRIIEAVEGTPMEAVFAERLFGPLGLDGTAMGEWRDPSRRLQGMRPSGLRFATAPEPDIAFASSGGGITTTGTDLLRWGRALNRGVVDDGIEWAGSPSADGRSRDPYRNGWYLDIDAGEERYYHGGRIQGFDAHLVRLPQRDAVVAVLSNLNGADLPAIVAGIESALAGEQPDPPDHRLSRSALRWLETEPPGRVAERMRAAIVDPPPGWRAEVRDLMDVAGYLVRQADNPRGAMPFAELAEELFPEAPMTFVFSGDIRRLAGDLEGARTAYERALDLRPDFPPARAALTRWFGGRAP